jgi:4-oxalocrotonate tautomerase
MAEIRSSRKHAVEQALPHAHSLCPNPEPRRIFPRDHHRAPPVGDRHLLHRQLSLGSGAEPSDHGVARTPTKDPTMPLVRISFFRDRSETETRAVTDGIYAALRATFAVPEGANFMMVERFRPGDFVYSPDYLGMNRSDELTIIQIFCNRTRTTEQKKALYAAVAETLGRNPGIPADDVLINLVEVEKENWSFGRGIAPYA